MKELISQAQQNDEQAISQLMGMVGQKSKFIALSYVNNDDSKADDIVQESYIKAFSSLDKLEDPNKFESWFYRILNNTAKDKIKRKLDKESSYFSELDYEDSNFEESIDGDYIEFQPKESFDYSELKNGMKEVLDELPLSQKEAVYMYYFEGLNAREIGDIFEVSEDTIRGRIRYAISKMKVKIEEMEKQGKALRGVAPIPFLLWTLKTESGSVIPTKLTASSIAMAMGSSSGTVASSTQPPALPKRSNSVPKSEPSTPNVGDTSTGEPNTSNVGNTPSGKPAIPKVGKSVSLSEETVANMGLASSTGTATEISGATAAKGVLAGLSTKALGAITVGVMAIGVIGGYTVMSIVDPVEPIKEVEEIEDTEETQTAKVDSETKTNEDLQDDEEMVEESIEEEVVETLAFPDGSVTFGNGRNGFTFHSNGEVEYSVLPPTSVAGWGYTAYGSLELVSNDGDTITYRIVFNRAEEYPNPHPDLAGETTRSAQISQNNITVVYHVSSNTVDIDGYPSSCALNGYYQ